MTLEASTLELNSHRLYLEELDKTKIVHIIKYTIYLIENNNLMKFTNSILFNFKLRNPMVLHPISKDQILIIDLFCESLEESKINNQFIKTIV